MKTEIVTINELLDKNYSEPYTGLFSVNVGGDANLQFMTGYNSDSMDFDLTHISALYGSRRFRAVSFRQLDAVDSFRKTWSAWLNANKANWQRVYDAIAEEYKPLENYNKTSTITTTYAGRETNTDTLADTHTTTYAGTETNTDTNDITNTTTYAGSEKNTTTHNTTDTTTQDGTETATRTLNTSESTTKSGTETMTDTIAGVTNSATDSFKAFDVPSASGSFADRGQTTQVNGAHTDTHAQSFTNRTDTTTNSGTDTTATEFDGRTSTETMTGTDTTETTFTGRTDTAKNSGSIVHAKEFDERTDTTANTGTVTHEKSFDERTDTVSENTYGNIGVTTNDAMLSSFVDLRVTLDFYKKLFKEFLYQYTW